MDVQIEIDLLEEIEEGLEGVAHWRAEKAIEHPADRRNQQAVDIAKALLASNRIIDPTTSTRFAHLVTRLEARSDVTDLVADYCESKSLMFRQIGFRSDPVSFTDVANDLCDVVDAVLAGRKSDDPRLANNSAGSIFGGMQRLHSALQTAQKKERRNAR